MYYFPKIKKEINKINQEDKIDYLLLKYSTTVRFKYKGVWHQSDVNESFRIPLAKSFTPEKAAMAICSFENRFNELCYKVHYLTIPNNYSKETLLQISEKHRLLILNELSHGTPLEHLI